jgi:hypothetical protein
MHTTHGRPNDIAYYRIRVRGTLDPHWANWFDGLDLSHDANADTLIEGLVTDQAALYGLLGKLRDLGLTLLSVERSEI